MLKRVLFSITGVLIIAGLLLGSQVNKLPERSFPQINGELHLAGLNAPVDVYRDANGIPHIYATTVHDLFFTQGYIQSQDRFFQMDFWRHIGSGRLSEMFGKSQVDTDIFLRRMGWARVAQQELETLDPQSLAILGAFSDGVNAYLSAHSDPLDISLEYAVMKLTNSQYRIEPWTPIHSLTWAKAMAWDLRGNMDEEGERATLLKTLTVDQIGELYPPYSALHPVIVKNPPVTGSVPQPSHQVSAQQSLAGVLEQAAVLKDRASALNNLLGPGGPGAGSNNWVISGKLTATGKPLLANDPHLGPQMPSIWYEVGLHCVNQSAACPIEVTGFAFASTPGVVIGHNARIAWGFTNVGPDVQDIYIEKINPANPDQYEVNGQWVDMRTLKETIRVAGGDPLEITVRYTRHGPILWDDPKKVEESRQKLGTGLPEQYRLALRWTALEPSNTFPAIWRMDTAQNWQEFRAAASLFDVPAQNFVYADVDGNIGYQMPGKIPIRKLGNSGRSYVAGWNDDHEWTGYIPFEQLPYAYNPPEGYIVTANNAVVEPDYPYLITTDWDYGYRAERINQLIQQAPGPIDIAYIQKIQGDNRNLSVDFLLPLLMQVQLGDAHQEQARALLNGWDGQQAMNSAPAALYNAFLRHVLLDIFGDDLPEDLAPDGGSRWFAVLGSIASQPGSFWWDNQKTKTVETRDDIIRAAFRDGLAELEKLQGKDPAKWNWGALHALTIRNKTFGQSGIGPIEALFNRGPFPVAGGQNVVNATGWDASKSYETDWLPSMRMIVDLSNLSNSLTINTTGESGHAYHPHYSDLTDLWRTIQYHPMRWEPKQTQSGAEGHLHLAP